jgi:hypothetical protein
MQNDINYLRSLRKEKAKKIHKYLIKIFPKSKRKNPRLNLKFIKLRYDFSKKSWTSAKSIGNFLTHEKRRVDFYLYIVF